MSGGTYHFGLGDADDGFIGMTADLDGTIVMSAGVGGSVDSGKILIGEIGVPGLDFPG